MSTEKKCNRCFVVKPLEDFQTSAGAEDGKTTICKECLNKRKREMRNANIERTRQKNKASYERNKYNISKRRKEFFSSDENKKKRSEYVKNYFNNLDKKEKRNEYRKKSNIKCKNRRDAWRRKYDKKRRMEPEYKIKDNLRRRLRSYLNGNPKPEATMKLIGCSIEELRLHLEKQFLPGMTWDNYGVGAGKTTWHIDHIVMLQEFNVLDENEIRLGFHYTNLRPLWAKDNVSKKYNIPRNSLESSKPFANIG